MADILPVLTVMAAGIFFAQFLKPFRVPYVVILILAGMLIGPFVLDIYEPDATTKFLGEIGLVFLMFMAGLETKFSQMPQVRNGATLLAFLNSSIPFIVGVGIALYFGYGWLSALLLGTIFISSSIAVIVPSLQTNNLLTKRVGRTILGATVMQDILSLIIFSFLLNTINPISTAPLPVYYTALFLFLFGLGYLIRELRKIYMSNITRKEDAIFEDEIRFTFVVLLGTVLIFELLGLHAILAGFFAGLALSGSKNSEIIKRKLHVVSYGLFIPIFFVLIGSGIDITLLSNGGNIRLLIATVVVGSIASKILSGFLAGRLSGFSLLDSTIIGSATIPQLSTTLAVAFTGLELGLLDQGIIIAMTLLSMATTFAGPFLIRYLLD